MSLSKEGIGGGIIKGVDMGSRTGFFNPVKSLKKLGKKAVGAVKDIASSDLGKAALLAAGTYYAGGGNLFGAQRAGMSGFKFANLPGAGFFAKPGVSPLTRSAQEVGLPGTRFGKFLSGAKDAITGSGNLGKFATLGALSTFLTSTLGMSEEQAEEEVARDPSKYLSLYYKNLNPKASEEEVQEFVTSNTSEYAEGGRIGYALGGNELPPDPTTPVNPFKPKPTGPVLPNKEMASNEISIDKIEMLIKRGADNDLIKEFTGASDGVIDQIRDAMERKNKAGGGIMNRIGFSNGPEIPEEFLEDLKRRKIEELLDQYYRFQEDYERRKDMAPTQEAAMGGRIGYALGDTASQNAMQAASIEGLPMRQNPKGVQELDLRDNGGFIPPVGIKEKEDDIPAMLSNNEFVFTADAVRGMGDGDVELGAQRMYDQMKMLEAGGKV
jgi:hypothetical protein